MQDRHRNRMLVLMVLGALAACGNDDASTIDPLGTPAAVQVAINASTATVSWSEAAGAESYFVELFTDNEATRSQSVTVPNTSAQFTGLTLDVTYRAEVSARRGAESTKAPVVSFRVPNPRGDLINEITAKFATSLHGTAKGMEYWYKAAGGYGAQINVNYATLGCPECHAYNSNLTGVASSTPCLACHPASTTDAGVPNYDAVDYNKCLGCHGRQAAEIAMNLPDVHRTRGMNCGDCHTSDEIHGGADRNAMWDVLSTSCVGCHKAGGAAPAAPATTSHSVHGGKLACQTCHMSGSVTCYNCHFNDEVTKKTKTAYKRFADWLFLGNFRGQVYPLNFQSVEYQGETFNAWGPFHGHTITESGRTCTACHGNANVLTLNRGGALRVTQWNSSTNAIDHLAGVIPVPPDYASSLRFDYVTRLSGTWQFVETGPDRSQMLYATPLTSTQMWKLDD